MKEARPPFLPAFIDHVVHAKVSFSSWPHTTLCNSHVRKVGRQHSAGLPYFHAGIGGMFLQYEVGQTSRKLALWSLRELSFTIHLGSRELGQIACRTLSGPFTIAKGGRGRGAFHCTICATPQMINLEPRKRGTPSLPQGQRNIA